MESTALKIRLDESTFQAGQKRSKITQNQLKSIKYCRKYTLANTSLLLTGPRPGIHIILGAGEGGAPPGSCELRLANSWINDASASFHDANIPIGPPKAIEVRDSNHLYDLFERLSFGCVEIVDTPSMAILRV